MRSGDVALRFSIVFAVAGFITIAAGIYEIDRREKSSSETGMVPLSDGWQVRVTTLDPAGRPAIFRHYLVFEADKDRAIALVRMDVSVNAGEAVEAVAPLARNEFLGHRMKPAT
jgi:hypothetical protein